MKIRKAKKHCEEKLSLLKNKHEILRGTIELKSFTNIFHDIKLDINISWYLRNSNKQGGDMNLKIAERKKIVVKIQRSNYAWLYFVKCY